MTAEDERRPITEMDLRQLLNRQTEAGNALVIAGLIEDWLEKLLLTAGRQLSNADASRIFGIGGPLSNFASKIEIAYMFELIDEAHRNDLRIIKSIRNAFAHTTRYVFFDSDHVAKNCRKLSNWEVFRDNQACYREKALECVNAMKVRIDRFMFAKAVQDYPSVDIDDRDE
ncbi:hypothetical protein [Bradyrhizobium sp. McL0616]|uniref:hypothetical protein n=1 Tax=Bradyrhizobium sp. McL0616 TaxID=3415674 RepID=UPI003CFA2470